MMMLKKAPIGIESGSGLFSDGGVAVKGVGNVSDTMEWNRHDFSYQILSLCGEFTESYFDSRHRTI